MSFFKETLLSISHGMRTCINTQLKDFLLGGRYGSESQPEEVRKTTGSGLNNLTFERYFGSLDASQNGRRHATLHFHSTLVMLKKHRNRLKEWLLTKKPEQREFLWSSARRGGRFLRKKHRDEEKRQLEMEEDEPEQAAAEKRKKEAKKASVKWKSTRKLVAAAKKACKAICIVNFIITAGRNHSQLK